MEEKSVWEKSKHKQTKKQQQKKTHTQSQCLIQSTVGQRLASQEKTASFAACFFFSVNLRFTGH